MAMPDGSTKQVPCEWPVPASCRMSKPSKWGALDDPLMNKEGKLARAQRDAAIQVLSAVDWGSLSVEEASQRMRSHSSAVTAEIDRMMHDRIISEWQAAPNLPPVVPGPIRPAPGL
jgi:hypothetical protein